MSNVDFFYLAFMKKREWIEESMSEKIFSTFSTFSTFKDIESEIMSNISIFLKLIVAFV